MSIGFFDIFRSIPAADAVSRRGGEADFDQDGAVVRPDGAEDARGGAGELITEFITAMKHRIGLNKILSTIHIYPTLSEANKYTAGEWKKANAPRRILSWIKKFHALRRNF